jgi:hypothetical protein
LAKPQTVPAAPAATNSPSVWARQTSRRRALTTDAQVLASKTDARVLASKTDAAVPATKAQPSERRLA